MDGRSGITAPQHHCTAERVAQWQAQLCGSVSGCGCGWGSSSSLFESLPKRQLYAARDACAASWVAAFRFTFLFEQIAGNFALTD